MKGLRLIICLVLSLAYSCVNNSNVRNLESEPTTEQQQLLDIGWKFHTPSNGDMPMEYGIVPIRGLLDNYFDIQIGEGMSLALKIVDVTTDITIRYVFAKENTSVSISEIPPGQYYLKMTYGSDWMVYEDSDNYQGKFTKFVKYEKSEDEFDFGKSSFRTNSIQLRINMIHDERYSNFNTIEIDEDSFFYDK